MKRALLIHDDLIGGMHSATQQKDGANIRTAFLRGDAELGKVVHALIVRAMQEDVELEAERSVDGDGPRFSNVLCSQCGQSFGPGSKGFASATITSIDARAWNRRFATH